MGEGGNSACLLNQQGVVRLLQTGVKKLVGAVITKRKR